MGAAPASSKDQRRGDLDEADMWSTSFALTNLTAADQKRIAALLLFAESLPG